jgi:ABC-2 type transport system ATP-binding protein
LINQGRVLLYGELDEIRRSYTGHAVLVRTVGALPELTGIEKVEEHNNALRLSLKRGKTPQSVLRELVEKDVPLEQFEIAIPTLDEIFIRVVQAEGGSE